MRLAAENNFKPVLRTTFYEFSESTCAKTDEKLIVGGDLLISPVLLPNRTFVEVYLPYRCSFRFIEIPAVTSLISFYTEQSRSWYHAVHLYCPFCILLT